MWKVTLWKIARWLFAKLAIETILAKSLTIALKKISSVEDLAKIKKTVTHCTESLNLMTSIIEDATVTEDEVDLVTSDLSALKKVLLETWAKGKAGKALEVAIAEGQTSVKPSTK